MLWGTFSFTHILSLFISAIIGLTLYFAIKNLSKKNQTIILFILSLSGIAAIIYNLLMWESPLEYLPLHLCSLNAMLLPFVVISKNKMLGNLLLLWALGALIALIVNFAQSDYKILSWPFAFYFFPHTLEFVVPILLFKLKLIDLNGKFIVSTVLITLISYTIIHFINTGLNNYFLSNNIVDYKGEIIKVNYMYSIYPDNPLLDFFYSIIPYSYWYMMLSIPIITIYLSLIYGISHYFKTRK